MVVPAADGTTDLSVLQNELKGRSVNTVLVAFDLLYLNGRDLRGLPLYDRKTALKNVQIAFDHLVFCTCAFYWRGNPCTV